MNFPVSTPLQLRVILLSMRRSSGLSQAQLGILLGVNQQRIAQIEKAPSTASIARITRLVAALGGRLVIEYPPRPAKTDESTW